MLLGHAWLRAVNDQQARWVEPRELGINLSLPLFPPILTALLPTPLPIPCSSLSPPLAPCPSPPTPCPSPVPHGRAEIARNPLVGAGESTGGRLLEELMEEDAVSGERKNGVGRKEEEKWERAREEMRM